MYVCNNTSFYFYLLRSVYLLSKKEVPQDNRTLSIRRKVQYKWVSKMFTAITIVFCVLKMPNVLIHFISMYYGTFEVNVLRNRLQTIDYFKR